MAERKRLPQSLEDSNLTKALFLRQNIAADLRRQRRSKPAVHHLDTLHPYSVHLSDCSASRPRIAEIVSESLFDLQLRRHLADSGCEQASTLSPLRNSGENNSLLDAVSLYMWGVRDSDLVLRTALYNTMDESSPAELNIAAHRTGRPGGSSDQRVASHAALGSEEWERIVRLVDPKSEGVAPMANSYLDIYLFVLANVIRRPIIVLGGNTKEVTPDTSESVQGPAGIYLPLLWDVEKCYHFPVVLGCVYPYSCFAPLVDFSAPGQETEILPLVTHTKNGPKDMSVHFLPECEETTKQICLQNYLQLTAVSVGKSTVPATRLKGNNLPENLNLVQDYFRLVNYVCGQLSQGAEGAQAGGREQGNRSTSPSFSITRDKCITEHCLYFASKLTWPFCHECSELSNCKDTPSMAPHPRHRAGKQETREYSSGSSFYGDRPSKVQLPAGPASAPSGHTPAPDPKSQQHRSNAGHLGQAAARLDALEPKTGACPHPRTEGGEAREARRPGAQKDPAAAGPVDLLCGRCIACKRETRTFNGLCFDCLQRKAQAAEPREARLAQALAPGWQGAGSRGQQPPGERCITPGCVYFGTEQHSGYCTVCYCSRGLPLPEPPGCEADRQQAPAGQPPQIASTLRNMPKCRAAGCGMLGNPSFDGFCEKCFLTHSRRAAQSRQTLALAKQEPLHERLQESACGEMREGPSGPSGKAQAAAALDRRPCRHRSCPNFGNSRCEGYCNHCYKKYQK
uniref:ubiquitinyl hydrolase 1 n=1 Tax=Lepisosteus oculatus TaxID=7918 RepID=W5M3T7_LEPOC|nr:PREDICTED: tumor necrosis factor alpha-induced protein 3-like [Lepisosteus oculatus]XP_015204123.1 PREDICTED: tumor necrosis factor alpha-induced protein 3-like [Lepisosteus oculatus]XP_015204124.1 PREDICTED: tumor necrosis factor alpha-induced protein 3-like [Lepisosteus oculatus]XP_015204125.1 PREDICTED: tumor necrosis factor alpha-induced protein 3-like [Lepisosteus oculatus]XP_015204126.1 PREDICTED: tumor necrosis factor alpha-induced protein 3-like [Lepisosteus oculatus]XP_015204127.1 